MKKIFTLIAVALASVSASAQNQTFKWAVPADFDLKEFHKIIEAKNEAGTLMGTIEVLSSPYKNQLYNLVKDENGVVNENNPDVQPTFDEENPNAAWNFIVSNTGKAASMYEEDGVTVKTTNVDISKWEEGFSVCIQGYGNPVLSEDEGFQWDEDKGKWNWKYSNQVYWTPNCGDLPKKGEYVKVTPTADGVMTVGIWIPKNGGPDGMGAPLYVIDESTKDAGYSVIPAADLLCKGILTKSKNCNDDQLYKEELLDENGAKVKDENEQQLYTYPFGETLPATIPVNPEYYSLTYQEGCNMKNGEPQRIDGMFFGTVSFNVKKDVAYCLLTPQTQLGLYGFKLEVGATQQGDPEGIQGISREMKSTQLYNLNGQRVNGNAKGLLIQNGRKVMFK